jgi:protein-S-isoprenylcysteine O-methyltransferase Ste14
MRAHREDRPQPPASTGLTWRPTWLLGLHLQAFALAIAGPVLLRATLVSNFSYDNGLIAFVMLIGGALIGFASIALYVWWSYEALQRRSEEEGVPRWTLGEGPYALSRNPCYLAICGICVAQAFWIPSIWLALYAAAVCGGLHARVIFNDEGELARLYGEDYTAYEDRVSRWLPWGQIREFLQEAGVAITMLIRRR